MNPYEKLLNAIRAQIEDKYTEVKDFEMTENICLENPDRIIEVVITFKIEQHKSEASDEKEG